MNSECISFTIENCDGETVKYTYQTWKDMVKSLDSDSLDIPMLDDIVIKINGDDCKEDFLIVNNLYLIAKKINL